MKDLNLPLVITYQYVTVPTNAEVDNIFVRQSIHGRYIDVTDDFMLSKNDTINFYRPSKLVRKFNSQLHLQNY